MRQKELENKIISTLLTNEEVLNQYLPDINENLFIFEESKVLIGKIRSCKNSGVVPSHESINDFIDESIDVYGYMNPVNVINFKIYLDKLQNEQSRRDCGNLCVSLSSLMKSKDFDVDAAISKINSYKIGSSISSDKTPSNKELIRISISEIEKAKLNKGLTGCPSGILPLDKLTGGWQRGDLVYLAGRPGMGKTSFAITQCINSSINKHKNVLFFSLEMSATQLMKKQISILSGIPLMNLSNDKDVDFKEINSSVQPIIDYGFKIIDNCFTIDKIKSKCVIENDKMKLDAIFIDYLQLINHSSGKGRSKENDVSEVSRMLKIMAKELGVAVVCLSQLSRSVENRGGLKIPQLSDLRDSGSLEQDADLVLFVYRPEYYRITEDEDGNSTIGKAIIIVAKNRHGALMDISLNFDKDTTKFKEQEITNSFNFIENNNENSEFWD